MARNSIYSGILGSLLIFMVHQLTADGMPSEDCRCGRSVVNRIIGGKPVTLADSKKYKWMTSLCYGKCSFETQFCAAMLIDNKYVLTAAHCVMGELASTLSVVIGDYNISTTGETVSIERNISKIIMHEKYKSISEVHDIALLKLDKPVKFKDTSIRPVCLPSDPDSSYTNVTATAIGWGNRSPTGSDFPKILHGVQVKVYSHDDCVNKTSYRPDEIAETMMCAADTKKDSCQGDSGGPLMYEHTKGIYTLIGIVSWGQGCAEAGYPGIYTRVTSYLEWIQTNTKGSKACSHL